MFPTNTSWIHCEILRNGNFPITSLRFLYNTFTSDEENFSSKLYKSKAVIFQFFPSMGDGGRGVEPSLIIRIILILRSTILTTQHKLV